MWWSGAAAVIVLAAVVDPWLLGTIAGLAVVALLAAIGAANRTSRS